MPWLKVSVSRSSDSRFRAFFTTSNKDTFQAMGSLTSSRKQTASSDPVDSARHLASNLLLEKSALPSGPTKASGD